MLFSLQQGQSHLWYYIFFKSESLQLSFLVLFAIVSQLLYFLSQSMHIIKTAVFCEKSKYVEIFSFSNKILFPLRNKKKRKKRNSDDPHHKAVKFYLCHLLLKINVSFTKVPFSFILSELKICKQLCLQLICCFHSYFVFAHQVRLITKFLLCALTKFYLF